MTTDNSLFNNDNNPAQDQAAGDPANTNDQPSLFHVGDGKKFGSAEELDKAYGHANEHISRLEEETAALREQLEAASSKQSAVDKVLEALSGKPEPEPQEQGETVEPANVEDVVAKLLAEREATSTQQTNVNKVRDALTAKYGDKVNDVYVARATELGVNLDTLSATSPDAVLALFDAKAHSAPSATPTSTHRAPNLQTHTDDEASPEARYKRGEITREQKFREQWRAQLMKENS